MSKGEAPKETRKTLGPERFFVTDEKNIGQRSARGAVATSTGKALRFGMQMASTAILARLLPPSDYGLVAMTAVALGLVGIFGDAGLAHATIQKDKITHRQVSTLFWINASIGLGLALTLILGAPLVAWFFDDTRLVAITSVMGAGLIFTGFTIQHQALLRRHMRFGVLSILDLSSYLIGVTVGISMAMHGAGYWSLVGIPLATNFSKAIGTWIALPWRPTLPTRGSGVRSMLSFGADILIFDIINFFARSADNILLGKFYGAGPLGVYDKAYSLLMLPISQINTPLASVALPALSRTKNDPERYNRFFYGAFELVACATLPIVTAIALFADQFVLVILGENWIESATLFRLLAFAAAIRAITNPVGWIMISRGETARYRRLGVATSVVIVSAFLVGISYGPSGIAIAYSVVMGILFFPIWIYAIKGSALSLSGVFRCLIPAIGSCLLAACVSVWVDGSDYFGVLGNAPLWVETLLAFSVFSASYAAVLLALFGRWRLFQVLLNELKSK